MSIDSPRKTEQIPHSNNFGPAPEAPVNTYDKTTLESAVENDLIKTPDHAGDLIATPNRKKMSRRVKVIGAVSGVALAGTLAGGVAIFASSSPNSETTTEASEAPTDTESDNSVVDTTSEQPAVEEPSTPESNVDVTQLPENVLTYNLFENLPQESQEVLLTLDKMTLADFRQQPVEDQLMFGDFIVDNNASIADYRLLKNGIVDLKNDTNPTTPETIYDSINYRFALLSSLKEYSADNGIVFDAETAKKASVVVANPENLEYQSYIDSRIDQWNVNTAMTINLSEVTAGEIDTEGVSRVNTESPTGEKTYDVASPKQFTNYLGQPDKLYTTDLSVIGTDVRYTDLSK